MNEGIDVTTHGPSGEPQVTIVGGVHGDEPAGVEIVERLRGRDIEFQLPTQLIVANTRAVEQGVRYTEIDLNRSFPGNTNGRFEERLASSLLDAVSDTVAMSIHTTHSTDTPFAVLETGNQEVRDIVAEMSVSYGVDPSPEDNNSLPQYGNFFDMEVGRQFSDEAVEQGERLAEEFLQVTGAVDFGLEIEHTNVDYFEMYEAVEKPSGVSGDCATLYDFEAENFELVEQGTVYARYRGEPLVAEQDFYPLLMSECGYDGVFGFKGRKIQVSSHE